MVTALKTAYHGEGEVPNLERQTSFKDWVRLSTNHPIAGMDDKVCVGDHRKFFGTGTGCRAGSGGRFQTLLLFGAVAVSKLDAVKSIKLSCHSKHHVVGDFKLEAFSLEGSPAGSVADLTTPVVRV